MEEGNGLSKEILIAVAIFQVHPTLNLGSAAIHWSYNGSSGVFSCRKSATASAASCGVTIVMQTGRKRNDIYYPQSVNADKKRAKNADRRSIAMRSSQLWIQDTAYVDRVQESNKL